MLKLVSQLRQVERIEFGFVLKRSLTRLITTLSLYNSRAALTMPAALFTGSALHQQPRSTLKTVLRVDCKAGVGKTMVGVYWDRKYFSKQPAPRRCAYRAAKMDCRSIRSSYHLRLIFLVRRDLSRMIRGSCPQQAAAEQRRLR